MDSSQDVFCAVGCFRARNFEIQKTEIAFFFGKARVAPMKALSIPKLEMQAALLASSLKEDTLRALSIDVNRTFLWNNSTTVLQGLHSVDKLPTFIANRICEIKELATVDQWFHVIKGDNTADTGTSGISAECLKKAVG